MTSYETMLKFKSTETHISGFCAKCCKAIPLASASCTLDINLSPAAESDQLEVMLSRAYPYTSGEDLESTFMGLTCPSCGHVMPFVDSKIAHVLEGLNRLKLFTIFSCEGHYDESTDPNTGMTMHSETSTPYVSFIGTGKLIKDIIVWNVFELGYDYIRTGGSMATIKVDDDETEEWPKLLAKLELDTKMSTIYARINRPITEESHAKACDDFVEAMETLLKLLPNWIREWYDNCYDDCLYYENTEDKKAALRKAWESNADPEDLIHEYQERGGCLNDDDQF